MSTLTITFEAAAAHAEQSLLDLIILWYLVTVWIEEAEARRKRRIARQQHAHRVQLAEAEKRRKRQFRTGF
jgi:hypothetical protein